jgi:hypothetical protein
MRAIASTLAAVLVAVGAASARAADSQAQSWNLTGETKARFTAKVVDILCELAGDCVADCGGGRRQLGLLASDGRLVLVNKNGEPIFSGAAVDLAPYCGKRVEVDGLMVGEGATRIYQVQLIRELGEGEFHKTDRWSKAWNEAHPDLAGKEGPWFRKDPLINAEIAREGYLGLGLDADRKFIEDEK